MRLIHLNDLHAWHKRPQSRTDEWMPALMQKLAQVTYVAGRLSADGVCIAGDLFHAPRVSPEVEAQLLRWGRGLPCPVFVIEGNHDLYHNRADTLPQTSLGVLVESGVFRLLTATPTLLEGSDQSVLLVGYGYPVAHPRGALEGVVESSDVPVVVLAHCYATAKGGEYFGAPVHSYVTLRATNPPVALWHFGHDHSDHGATEIEGAWFVNLGALMRGSLAREEINRDIKIGVSEFTKTGRSVRQIKITVPPAAEVFDLRAKAALDQEQDAIAAFVARLETDFRLDEELSLEARVQALDSPPVVRERVQQYLRDAEED